MTPLNKALHTITEVSQLLNLPNHVLRFWEQKFSKITPHKNNGRRYYREEDIKNLEIIKDLLYNKGYTIKGVQKYFADQHSLKPLVAKKVIEINIEEELETLIKTLYKSKATLLSIQ